MVLAGALWLASVSGTSAAGDPLAALTEWAIGRALPGAKVDVAAVKVLGVSELDIRGLVVRDRTSGAEVLRIDSGRIAVSVDGLMKARIDELRLVNPVITANSAIGALFGGAKTGGGSGGGWSIGRLVCDYGEVQFGTTGDNAALVRWKFALDWKDLGAKEPPPLSVLLWDIQGYAAGVAAPFLLLDRVEVTARAAALAEASIDSARLAGGRLFVGPALEKLFSGAASGGDSGASQWKIGKLAIERVGVTVEDKRPEVSDITFVLNTELKDLSLSGAAGALGQTPQQVEIADLDVRSPYDPLVRVLSLRSIFLRFTLAGLLRQEIESVRILNPTVHISEDLFWYMEEAQQRFGGEESSPGGKSWIIRELGIEFGRLVLASGGRERYGLPLNFRATARDVALDNLASLELRTELEIPAQEYAFESYQLTIQARRGDLQFSYPPEQGRKNLVGKIFVERILWRQYRAGDAWISATFDREGINGEFGGVAYGGYVSGGFTFLFDAKSPWIGWLAGTGIDLKKLTDVIAPQNFRMTGPVNFRLQMDAFGRNIERIKGDLRTRGPGTLRISKLDDLLANIPADWPAIKSSSMRVALENLRDFDYLKAGGRLWFVREQGRLDLRLQGPAGSRTFDVVLHADESKEGRWKK